ncbi:FtsX-like permease family protein [Kitasatospora sp. NPDC057542]|uniref:FtsX-like permease family protein n=1 Tax=Kitasatospora sp. NPDC057542 TaxID=3346162 RepID=UPI0036B6749A
MRARFYPLLLGVRLVRGYGRSGWARVVLMAGGTALGVVVLLLAIAVPGMLQHRADRADARTVICAATDDRAAAGCGLLGESVSDSWYGRPLQRQLVPEAAAAPPPGLNHLPAPGEVALSPALRALYDKPGNQALRDRLPGRATETITADGLLQPDELLAYVGVASTPGAPTQQPAGYGPQAHHVTGPAVVAEAGAVADARKNTITLIVGVIAVLTPVLLFLASCARLSAATRDRRLAALRLLGVTPRQAQVVNAGESAVVATLGALAGLAIFEALLPFTSRWTVAGYGWYAADLQPPLWQIAALIVAVPILAVGVGAVAVRRITATTRAGRADAMPKALSPWRLAPLAAGVAVTGYAAASSPPDRGDPNTSMLLIMAAGLLLVFIGLAAGTPLIARSIGVLLGRVTRSIAVLLGARRLEIEAAATTRVVSGLVLLVFAGAFGQSMLAAIQSRTDAESWVQVMAPGVYQGPAKSADGTPLAAATFADIPGVRSVVPVRRLQTPMTPVTMTPAQGIPGRASGAPAGTVQAPPRIHNAVVLTCAELSAVINKAPQSCEEGTAYWLTQSGQPAGLGNGAPLTLAPAASAASPVTVAAPTRTLTVPDRSAVSDGSPVAADMLLPPSTPGLSAETLPATTYLIVTDGEQSTFEALNAAAARVDPSLTVSTPDIALEAQYQFPLFRALLTLGTILVLAISCAAIAVGSIDRAIERRREVALQAVVGVPLPTMRRAQLLQVLIPYGTGITLALGLAILVGRAYGRAGGTSGAIPLGGLTTVATIAIAGAAVAGLSALPALGRGIKAEFLHRE